MTRSTDICVILILSICGMRKNEICLIMHACEFGEQARSMFSLTIMCF